MVVNNAAFIMMYHKGVLCRVKHIILPANPRFVQRFVCRSDKANGKGSLLRSVQRTPSLVAYFTQEVNPRLAKCPLVYNGRLANRWLTSLVK